MALNDFGPVPLGSVLPCMFTSHDLATGANEAASGIAVTDIEIYKAGSTTQRSSDAGYVLLDTDGIDFDGHVGVNGISIDTGDNTDAGFFVAGSFYDVILGPITIDTRTVNVHLATFRLTAAEGVAGVPDVNVTHVGDTAQTAGDLKASLNTIDDFLDTEIAAILEDTGTTLDDFIDTEVAAIKTKTDQLTFTLANHLDVNLLAVSGTTAHAAKLSALLTGHITGAVNAGVPTTTSFIADGFTEATNDHFNGRLITWTSGALLGQQTDITDYVGATQTFTVTAMTEAPADNDTFVIT